MKYLKAIVSCLIGCAASALPAQTYLGAIYQGFSSTVEIPVTIYASGTLASIQVLTGGSPNLDFTYTGTGSCVVGAPVTAQTNCTIGVKFAPTMTGARYGGYVLMNQDGSIAGGAYLLGNGVGPQMSFQPGTKTEVSTGYYMPKGIAVDEAGNLYSAEGSLGGTQGYVLKNGVPYATAAWNNNPDSIGVDGGGLLYTSNAGGSYVQMFPTISQQPVPFKGHAAVDAWGNIFSACAAGVCMETLQWDGSYVESTLASGLTPNGIAVDGNGNVFVAAGTLYKFAPAGSSYTETTIGSGLSAVSVATDGAGDVYVGDASGSVFKETVQQDGSYLQSLLIASGVYPGSLASDMAGNLYFFQAVGTDKTGKTTYSIFKQSYSAAPALTFANTLKGSQNSDGAKTVTITNSGNLPLQFSGITFPADFIEASNAATECTASTVLEIGQSCTLTARFAPVTPVASGSSVLLQEQIVITTNNGNQPGAQQTISLSGTELAHVVAPTVSLPGGVYYTTQDVTVSTSTPGAVMYYTLNGTTPTTASTKVTGPIHIWGALTLKVIAVLPGVDTSAVTSTYYALTAPTPVITPVGGTYNGTQMVTITTATPIQAIYYTTAGNYPTTSSPHYTGPITVNSTQLVVAFAAQTGFLPSPYVKQKFTITK